jgi:hypothetical protein
MKPIVRHASIATGLVGAIFVTVILLTRGPPPPIPNPPGTFSFAAFGDSPYYFFEEPQYRVVLKDLAANDLSMAVHVGDLFWTSCTTERYQRSLDEFNSLPHPLIYTPGDNEWTDCWGTGGGFTPLDRLAEIRRLFYQDPAKSLGGRAIELEHQGASGAFEEYVENARWTHEGVVFATMHLVGSWNGMAMFDGRTDEDDAESRRRTEAAAAWLSETFAEARSTGAVAVVLAFHANPGLEDPADDNHRQVFEPFLAKLEEEVALFGRPVLGIHGDWHEYIVDHPLTERSTGRTLENFTRLRVPGSFDVGWVRVTVAPGDRQPFAFESRVVPHWKYW